MSPPNVTLETMPTNHKIKRITKIVQIIFCASFCAQPITHALAAGEIGNVRANYAGLVCKVLNEADFLLLSGHLEVDAGHISPYENTPVHNALDIFLIQIRLNSYRGKLLCFLCRRHATFLSLFCYKDTEDAEFAPKNPKFASGHLSLVAVKVTPVLAAPQCGERIR
jgi:hypothetical protein